MAQAVLDATKQSLQEINRAPMTSQVNAGTGVGLRPLVFDFAALSATGAVFPIGGSQLIFLRRGSYPGARLDVSIGGTVIEGFRPGCRIKLPFNSVQVKKSLAYGSQITTSNIIGQRLVQPASFIVTDPGADYEEPNPLHETDGRLWPIMGDTQSPGGGSWAALGYGSSADIPNTGVSTYWSTNATWFNPLGFKRLRVYLDGGVYSSGNYMTSCRLVPWLRMPVGSGAPSGWKLFRFPAAAFSVAADAETYDTGFDGPRYTAVDIDNPLYSHRNVAVDTNSNPLITTDGAGGEMTFQLVEVTFVGSAPVIRCAVDGIETP